MNQNTQNLSCSDENEKKETMSERFDRERTEWTTKIKVMSEKSRYMNSLAELQVDVISERQCAVDYYHFLRTYLLKINKKYKIEYSKKYDFYTNGSNIRYPNENSKNAKILADLADIIETKDEIDNHLSFLLETIKTIDNLIYGVKHRISIEEFTSGMK